MASNSYLSLLYRNGVINYLLRLRHQKAYDVANGPFILKTDLDVINNVTGYQNSPLDPSQSLGSSTGISPFPAGNELLYVLYFIGTDQTVLVLNGDATALDLQTKLTINGVNLADLTADTFDTSSSTTIGGDTYDPSTAGTWSGDVFNLTDIGGVQLTIVLAP